MGKEGGRKYMKNKVGKIVALISTLCLTAGLLSGCEEEVEPVIEFPKFSCTESLKENIFEGEDFFITSYDVGTRYHGYQMPTVQVDDHIIELGKTSLGEVYEMFMGITVEDQIKTAKAEDDGALEKTPEEIEAEKILAEVEKDKEKNKNDQTEIVFEEKEPVYSFYIRFDEGDARTYAPIYLISSDLVLKETVQIYKHGMPYVQLNISNLYVDNKGILQESDLIITGVEPMMANRVKYADIDGFSLAAKQNIWLNGGFSFTGDKYEFTTLPRVFESWGLKEGDGYQYNSEYFTRTQNEKFYYYAHLYCYDPIYYHDDVYIYKTVIKYEINRDTQKIVNLTINIEEYNHYYSDTYDVGFNKPPKVFGENI